METVRERMLGKVISFLRTGMATLLIVCGVILNIVSGTVLLSVGLLCRAGD
ncbi:MAG: hypothetical protein WCP85_20210 [Mariniphaga sp.]